MQVRCLAIGNKMPAWVNGGVAEYQKRLPREWRFDFVELPLGGRAKNRDLQQAIQQESESMLKMIDGREHVIALDLNGKNWSTEDLGQQLQNWQFEGQNISFLIGGPDGLGQPALSRANQKWCLSALTLPHPLVRVLLVEQLYRAWSLLNNHPYHK